MAFSRVVVLASLVGAAGAITLRQWPPPDWHFLSPGERAIVTALTTTTTQPWVGSWWGRSPPPPEGDFFARMLSKQTTRHRPDQPEPVGELPEKSGDGTFSSKKDACQACKFMATGSCTMYKTCVCHAINSYFGVSGAKGVTWPTDQSNWHWACDNSAGAKYEQCFSPPGMYKDSFDDKIDPNAPKCPEKV